MIHPQSIVHSLVEYVDGSVLAQLGSPDMRTPIAHALAWPQRVSLGCTIPRPREGRNPAIRGTGPAALPGLALAQEAARAGGSRPASLNAANEVAVEAFLEGD